MALKPLNDSPEWYKRVPAQIGAGAIEGLGIPGSLIDLAQNLAVSGTHYLSGGRSKTYEQLQKEGGGYRIPTVEDIRKHITEPIFGQELLTPQSFPEKVIKATAQTAPQIAAAAFTGGASTVPGILSSVGRNLSGSAAAIGAQELGLPVPVQFFAGIAGEKGFDKVLNRALKQGIPKNTLATMADQAKKEFYAKEQELGSKIKLEAPTFKNTLSSIEKKVAKDTRLGETERSQLLRDIDQYNSDFVQGKIPASALSTRRKELNYNISNSRGPAKDYYQALANPARAAIEQTAKTHPDWYKNLKAGDAIHEAENFKNTFISGLDDYPKLQKALKNPLSYGAALLGPSLFWTRDPLSALGIAAGATGGAYLAGKPISKGLDLYGFVGHPETRSLLLKASEEMINRNFPAALRSYTRLDDMADQYQKKQNAIKKQSSSKSTSRLVPLR